MPAPVPLHGRQPPDGWPATPARFAAQRWLVDLAVRTVGVDWDQGRSRYLAAACGTEGDGDFARIREQVTKLADIDRVFAAAARRRDERADAALAAGHERSAGRHSFVAAVLWGGAEWPFFLSREAAARAAAANAAKVSAFDRAIAHAGRRIERLELVVDDVRLPALLHLPLDAAGPVPCVIHYGGMDSFKEHAVALDGDRFLERGIARLAFDGPGQGEAIHAGVFVDGSNMIRAGRAALDAARRHPAIDPDRLGISGVSFGSFWATQLAATAPDVVGTAVWATIHEPGCRTLFETASPTFKARFMAMSGMVDEAGFDRLAATFGLHRVAGGIERPYLALAGEDDELSPITSTYRLLERIPAPRELVLYRGERHSLGGGPAARLGPGPIDLAAEWFVDRFAGRQPRSGVTVVESTGASSHHPLDAWLAERRGPRGSRGS